MECPICVSHARSMVKCSACDYQACRNCIQRYLLDNLESKCPNCAMAWDEIFLSKQLSKTWVNTAWKNHQKSIWFNLEKEKFPETLSKMYFKGELQEIRDNLLAMEARINDLVEQIVANQTNRKIFEEMRTWKNRKPHTLIDRCRLLEVAPAILYEIEQLRYDYHNNARILRETRNDPRKSRMVISSVPTEEIIKFLCPCPYPECQGLIQSSNFTCKVCDQKICRHCRMVLSNDHSCKEEDKASIALIRKDTKPCPNCATLIHKIDGCSQMWCPKCHSVYNYHTGQKDMDLVHNPHAIEYLRSHGAVFQNGRWIRPNQECDVPALTEEEWRFMRDRLQIEPNSYIKLTHVYGIYSDLDSLLYHWVYVDIDRDRARYLFGQITEKQFKIHLLKYHRSQRYQDMAESWIDTYHPIISEMLRSIFELVRRNRIVIQQRVDQVLADFEALKIVMRQDLDRCNFYTNRDFRIEDDEIFDKYSALRNK